MAGLPSIFAVPNTTQSSLCVHRFPLNLATLETSVIRGGLISALY